MKTLILVPTELELRQLKQADSFSALNTPIEICGFGVIGAGIGASHFIQLHQPDRVLLAGIAGSFDAQLEIGKAFTFDSVCCDGVGISRDGQLLSPAELNFSEQPLITSNAADGGRMRFTLNHIPEIDQAANLLTCCESSRSPEIAAARKLATSADAEDMEGYAVAMACALKEKPLMIIRGISNMAGDHQKQNWNITDALDQTAAAMITAVQSVDWKTR